MITPEQMHPDHQITVTGGGPFGRAYFECTCGIDRTFASKHAANVSAMAHFEATTSSGPGRPAPAAVS